MRDSCELRATSYEQAVFSKLEARSSKRQRRRQEISRLRFSAKGYENEM
jgi:hypothetical protein